MSYYERATAGRKPIALAHKTRPTSGVITNAKAHAKLRAREVDIRIQTLNRNIKLHEGDPDNDRDLNRLLNSWRRELMELKLEASFKG
jgi:hypothetical protein